MKTLEGVVNPIMMKVYEAASVDWGMAMTDISDSDEEDHGRIFSFGKIFVYTRLTINSAIKMKSFDTQPFKFKNYGFR